MTPFDHAPMIDWMRYLPEEQELLQILNHQISNVEMFYKAFENELSLFEFCSYESMRLRSLMGQPNANHNTIITQRFKLLSWKDIASRSGALTIWDFGHNAHLIGKTLKKCDRFKTLVSMKDLEDVFQTFSKNFPNAKRIRDAVSHRADLLSTPFYNKKNTFDGDAIVNGVTVLASDGKAKGSFVTGTVGERVAITIDGELKEYEMSRQTLNIFGEMRRAIFQIFRVAAEMTSNGILSADMSASFKPRQ